MSSRWSIDPPEDDDTLLHSPPAAADPDYAREELLALARRLARLRGASRSRSRRRAILDIERKLTTLAERIEL